MCVRVRVRVCVCACVCAYVCVCVWLLLLLRHQRLAYRVGFGVAVVEVVGSEAAGDRSCSTVALKAGGSRCRSVGHIESHLLVSHSRHRRLRDEGGVAE